MVRKSLQPGFQFQDYFTISAFWEGDRRLRQTFFRQEMSESTITMTDNEIAGMTIRTDIPQAACVGYVM